MAVVILMSGSSQWYPICCYFSPACTPGWITTPDLLPATFPGLDHGFKLIPELPARETIEEEVDGVVGVHEHEADDPDEYSVMEDGDESDERVRQHEEEPGEGHCEQKKGYPLSTVS